MPFSALFIHLFVGTHLPVPPFAFWNFTGEAFRLVRFWDGRFETEIRF